MLTPQAASAPATWHWISKQRSQQLLSQQLLPACPFKGRSCFFPCPSLSRSSQAGQRSSPSRGFLSPVLSWGRAWPCVQGCPRLRVCLLWLWGPEGMPGVPVGGSVTTFTPAGMCSQHGSHSQHIPGKENRPGEPLPAPRPEGNSQDGASPLCPGLQRQLAVRSRDG